MSILPTSVTALQNALEQVTKQTFELDANLIRSSRDPLQCDVALLPWLAWENSISDGEGWLFAEVEESKRKLVADYIVKHEFKGTPSSIRQLFHDLGLGEIDIVEDVGRIRYDGVAVHDAIYIHGSTGETWAVYNIILKQRPITNDQAAFLKSILSGIAPSRCQLRQIIYIQAAIRYNKTATYNGQFNHGASNG